MSLKHGLLLFCLSVLAVLFVVRSAAAQTNANSNGNTAATTVTDEAAETVEAGILPDSPLYVLKSWWEDVRVAFTFDETKKAELEERLAAKRLAEFEQLVAKGKVDLAERHLAQFERRLSRVEERLEHLQQRGKDVDTLLEKLQQRRLAHQEVLQRVYDQVPEEARERILQAMENSAGGLENAMERIQKSEQVKQFKEKLEMRIESQLQNVNSGEQGKWQELKDRLRERAQLEIQEWNSGTQTNTNANAATGTQEQVQPQIQTQNLLDKANSLTQ